MGKFCKLWPETRFLVSQARCGAFNFLIFYFPMFLQHTFAAVLSSDGD
jgi:hypothetical protein